MARSNAYDTYPDHTLEFDPDPAQVRIRVSDVLLAHTSRALTLREGRYPPVVYLPREEIDMRLLQPTTETYHCPFKGDASFFDFRSGESHTPKVAWSYEDPFDQVLELRGLIAFYGDRVHIEVLDS